MVPIISYPQGPSLSQQHRQLHSPSPNLPAMVPNPSLPSSYSDASPHHYAAITPPQLVSITHPLGGASSSFAPSSSSPRFQPYSRPSLSSTPPAPGSGNLSSMPPPSLPSALPPTYNHHPVPHTQTRNQSPVSLRNQFYPTLPLSHGVNDNSPAGGGAPLDFAPFNAGYPGTMYGELPLPDAYMPLPVPVPNWEQTMHEPRVGPDDYAQVIDIYSHIYNALPYLVPSSHPAPSPPVSIPPGMCSSPLAYDSLIDLASDGHRVITGQNQESPDPASAGRSVLGGVGPGGGAIDGRSGGVVGTGGRKTSSGSKKEHAGGAPNKCLGCGATKTPEWRRGPMGPRTLCNACGLVHMKLQRKKRKAEEKEKIAAAPAADS